MCGKLPISWRHGRGCGSPCCIHLVDIAGSRGPTKTRTRTLGTWAWIGLVLLSGHSWPLRSLGVGHGGVHRLWLRLLLLLLLVVVKMIRACCRRRR